MIYFFAFLQCLQISHSNLNEFHLEDVFRCSGKQLFALGRAERKGARDNDEELKHSSVNAHDLGGKLELSSLDRLKLLPLIPKNQSVCLQFID
jgi:hypothetical protein